MSTMKKKIKNAVKRYPRTANASASMLVIIPNALADFADKLFAPIYSLLG